MNILARFCLLLCCLIGGNAALWAQSGIYIPASGKVYLANDTATIFANMTVKGKLGMGKNAVLNFSGQKWTNDQDAILSDATDQPNTGTNGGTVRFTGSTVQQTIDGGHNAATGQGPRFSNIIVQNSRGVVLANSSTKIAGGLDLRSGYVYLRNNNLTLGHDHPGSLQGYNENRFIVTGTQPGSGFLLREGILPAHGLVPFPIGTTEGSYTPAAVRLLSGKDDIGISVFNGVRSGVTSGLNLNPQSVGKTWQLTQRRRPGTGSVAVMLQHNAHEEGDQFKANNRQGYIAQYKGTYWDTTPGTQAGPGTITTGTPVPSGRTHSRQMPANTNQDVFLTKFTLPDLNLVTKLTLYGFRIDPNHTRITWGTQPEVNIRTFVVQRWYSNDRGFVNVDTVNSQAPNGFSNSHLYYQVKDNNSYTGVTFYRLMIIAMDGSISYSETIAIGGMPGEPNMMLWPNPTPDICYVSINTALDVKSVIVWDTWGQKLFEEPVNGRRVLPISLKKYAQAFYVVGIVSPSGKLLGTEKVMKLVP